MRTKIDALYDLVHKMSGAGAKDDSIVEMIDQITKAYDNGGGSGGGGGTSLDNVAFLTELPYETTPTQITDENDIAELEKVRKNFIEKGIIPVVAYGTRDDISVLFNFWTDYNENGSFRIIAKEVYNKSKALDQHEIVRQVDKATGNVTWTSTYWDSEA